MKLLCKLGLHKPHKWTTIALSRLVDICTKYGTNFSFDNYQICVRCGAIKSKTGFIPKEIVKVAEFYAPAKKSKRER